MNDNKSFNPVQLTTYALEKGPFFIPYFNLGAESIYKIRNTQVENLSNWALHYNIIRLTLKAPPLMNTIRPIFKLTSNQDLSMCSIRPSPARRLWRRRWWCSPGRIPCPRRLGSRCRSQPRCRTGERRGLEMLSYPWVRAALAWDIFCFQSVCIKLASPQAAQLSIFLHNRKIRSVLSLFLTPTTSSVSLRQKGARQTGRAQRPQPESTPDWDPAQAGGAH